MTSEQKAAYLARMRWRCRRGLLELDIVLGRFVEHYESLDAKQRQIFDEMLELPDNTLWDMISGRTKTEQDEQYALLEIIKAV
jgi:antitoxin CptB